MCKTILNDQSRDPRVSFVLTVTYASNIDPKLPTSPWSSKFINLVIVLLPAVEAPRCPDLMWLSFDGTTRSLKMKIKHFGVQSKRLLDITQLERHANSASGKLLFRSRTL